MKLEQQKSVMQQIYDIVDVIVSQILDKLYMIPYSIRQFCKCLYESAKIKFPKSSEEEFIQLIGTFVLDRWLLKSMFMKPNVEGLVKEFFLHQNCRKNLLLTKLIVFKTMTFQEWELQPQDVQQNDGRDNFCMPGKLK